jgi:hypothetical protein
MPMFWFQAPGLDDPQAAPLDGADARPKRIAHWLGDQLRARGVAAMGPHADADGWNLSVDGEDGFVFATLRAKEGAEATFGLYLTSLDAEPEAERAAHALAAILGASEGVSLLGIDHAA